jgi:hypothetical protein
MLNCLTRAGPPARSPPSSTATRSNGISEGEDERVQRITYNLFQRFIAPGFDTL